MSFDAFDGILKAYKKAVKAEMTFMPCFNYWRRILLEQACRLFSYKGLPDSIPAHEIDLISYVRGYTPLVLIADSGKRTWIAANSSGMYGLTDYLDMFTMVNFDTPLHFGERTIDKNAVIIPNNSLKTPLIWRIDHYAAQLAHVDISLIAELVNDREVDVMEAINSVAAQAMQEQYSRRYDGVPSVIVNKGFSQFKHNFLSARSQDQAEKLWQLRNNIISGFLEEIGVKKSFDKRERQITSEIQADDAMLKLNITDMLECRQAAFKKFEELSGIHVEVTSNIDYTNYDEGGVNIESTP